MARLPSPTVARSAVQPARYWTDTDACGTRCKGAEQQMHPKVLNVCRLFDKQVSDVSCSECVAFCFVIAQGADNYMLACVEKISSLCICYVLELESH